MRWWIAALIMPAMLAGQAMAQTIAEGQVWTVKDAPADTVRLVIQRIEPWSKGDEVVHVSLFGAPTAPGFAGHIEHLPFQRAALEASLDRLTGETPPPDLVITQGYKIWKDDRGGIFTISVAEVVKIILDRFLTTPPAQNAT